MSRSVLIVDDSLTVRMDLAEAFERGRSRRRCVRQRRRGAGGAGREPLRARRSSTCCCPTATASSCFEEIRDDPATRDLPVMLLSTEAEVRDRIRGLQTGADDYVGKPYDRPTWSPGRASCCARGATTAAAGAGHRPGDRRQPDLPRGAGGSARRRPAIGVVTAGSGEEGLADRRRAAADRDHRRRLLPGHRRRHGDPADSPRRGAARHAVPAADRLGRRRRRAPRARSRAPTPSCARRRTSASSSRASRRCCAAPAPRSTADRRQPARPKRILAVDDSPTYLHRLSPAWLRGEATTSCWRARARRRSSCWRCSRSIASCWIC